tara:strand:- start:1537 stop:2229 length:693 start_codon:yes stop_codon:yes gene_type:complete
MKFPKRFKIHRTAGKPGVRMSLDQVHLFKRKGRPDELVASDGRCLAIVPVSDSKADKAGPITVAAMKKALAPPNKDDAQIEADGQTLSVKVKDAKVSFQVEPIERPMPDPDKVAPKGPVLFRAAINAKLLAQVAEAIGTEGPVILEFYDHEGPIGVKALPIVGDPDDSPYGRGLLMPMTLDKAQRITPTDAPTEIEGSDGLTSRQRAAHKAVATRRANAEKAKGPGRRGK